ncbi:hypothetical protein TWF192_009141 [Orbilia oligospora]|uniref:Uncharacterized protein n=1 Tax=Orbilia oligospora TaxID=2813651 RepID=A0A6G1MLV8_ORBOL|nr:hypothetical protein TWF191_007629 [Orbilia oligospora]KAF3261209.1 hypothetical protein TWF192_009141 [Orbilia oligospora]
MPCKSIIAPSEILDPSEVPAPYIEDFVRLRWRCENTFYLQSIGKQERAVNMVLVERLEKAIRDHFAAVRRKNEMFGVYDRLLVLPGVVCRT